MARSNTGAEPPVRVAGIAITHGEKILWPQTARSKSVRKADLARYYEIVAPRMLPHIVRRPLSMVRAPDGIAGERFFQRHAIPGIGAGLPISVAGEKKPFFALDSAEDLGALAQAAVLEIHPWGCKPGDPETPERVIFDLDPAPERPFVRTIEAAQEVREALSLCGLTPFVKTTGGKGLHVVAAIKGTPKNPATWEGAKDFARGLAERLAAVSPVRFTTSASKAARAGKIFIDYLRNARMATAVAPWSLRARLGAPIALPLAWRDVRKGLDPADFTVGNVAALIKCSDPWKGLAASAASLEAARQALLSARL